MMFAYQAVAHHSAVTIALQYLLTVDTLYVPGLSLHAC